MWEGRARGAEHQVGGRLLHALPAAHLHLLLLWPHAWPMAGRGHRAVRSALGLPSHTFFTRLLAPSRAFVTPSHALSRLLSYDPHSGYLRRPEACNQRVHVSWGNYQVSRPNLSVHSSPALLLSSSSSPLLLSCSPPPHLPLVSSYPPTSSPRLLHTSPLIRSPPPHHPLSRPLLTSS